VITKPGDPCTGSGQVLPYSAAQKRRVAFGSLPTEGSTLLKRRGRLCRRGPDDRLRPRRPRVARVMIAAAITTIPAMITNTSNYGRPTTATRPVAFTMALCMDWNNPAINTLEPALL
jgi:hypothetical protein